MVDWAEKRRQEQELLRELASWERANGIKILEPSQEWSLEPLPQSLTYRGLRLRELREQRSRELQFRISLAVLFAWILLGVVDKAMGCGYLSVVEPAVAEMSEG
jgi:hypothetical protein